MILTYAEIAETAGRKGEPVVSPVVLGGRIHRGLARLCTRCGRAGNSRWAVAGRCRRGVPGSAGAIFLGAGLYQFSELKHACLTQCQRPFAFFFANWTTRPLGVFLLGLRQGVYCLGCCWAMMLLMFAVGTMNIVWMALLGVLMAVEKMATTARFATPPGVAFMAIGLGIVRWDWCSEVDEE